MLPNALNDASLQRDRKWVAACAKKTSIQLFAIDVIPVEINVCYHIFMVSNIVLDMARFFLDDERH